MEVNHLYNLWIFKFEVKYRGTPEEAISHSSGTIYNGGGTQWGGIIHLLWRYTKNLNIFFLFPTSSVFFHRIRQTNKDGCTAQKEVVITEAWTLLIFPFSQTMVPSFFCLFSAFSDFFLIIELQKRVDITYIS